MGVMSKRLAHVEKKTVSCLGIFHIAFSVVDIANPGSEETNQMNVTRKLPSFNRVLEVFYTHTEKN